MSDFCLIDTYKTKEVTITDSPDIDEWVVVSPTKNVHFPPGEKIATFYYIT